MTKTLIPMAALDDMVGCAVFFSVIAVVAGNLSAGQMPAYMVPLIDLAAQSSTIDSSYFENPEEAGVGGLLHGLSTDVRHSLSAEDQAFLHQAAVIRVLLHRILCLRKNLLPGSILIGHALPRKEVFYRGCDFLCMKTMWNQLIFSFSV